MSSSSSSSHNNEEQHNINLISQNDNNNTNNNNNSNQDNNQDNYVFISVRTGNNGDETAFIINNPSQNPNQTDTIPIHNFTKPPYSLSATFLSLLFTILYLSSSSTSPSSTTIPITIWSISQKHQYFTLFTSNFIHSNFPQLLYNIIFLLLTFSLCEKHIGTVSSWFLFISFTFINSLFYYCYKLLLDYFNYYTYETYDIGLTPIIFMYFTFIQNVTKSYNLFVWGFISYVILIVLKYIYNPFNVLVGVCAGWVCLLLNKRFVLLPKKEWLYTFEQLCNVEYDVTVFNEYLIVMYCFSKRDKNIIDKYY